MTSGQPGVIFLLRKGKSVASNVSKGMAIKGSRLRMQQLANSSLWRERLNVALQDELKWLSPLGEDNFAEYQLNHEEMLHNFMISGREAESMFPFWPWRQPQWGGIALGKQGTLYLLEAKSHMGELKSKLAAADPKSRELIQKTLAKIKAEAYPQGNYDSWLWEYYQFANRLAFLHLLNDTRLLKRLHLREVRLVFVNFANDVTMGKLSTTEEQWQNSYFGTEAADGMLEKILGTREIPERLVLLSFNITTGKINFMKNI